MLWAAPKESGPDLAPIEAGSSDVPSAQRFPLAVGEEGAPIAVTAQITFDFSALLSVTWHPPFGGEKRLEF